MVKFLSLVEFAAQDDPDVLEQLGQKKGAGSNLHYQGASSISSIKDSNDSAKNKSPFVRPEKRIGRNELCPCGSGEKYKRCCGKIGTQ